MNELASFLSGSRLVDIVIALTFVEAVVLMVYHRSTGRGVAPRDFLLNMLSGLCLMLALRNALNNTGWPWIALLLSSAGLLHALDMGRRWVGQSRR